MPDNTYLKSFIETHKNQFPKDGWSGDIYFGRMVPERDLERLDMLTKELRKLPSLYSKPITNPINFVRRLNQPYEMPNFLIRK